MPQARGVCRVKGSGPGDAPSRRDIPLGLGQRLVNDARGLQEVGPLLGSDAGRQSRHTAQVLDERAIVGGLLVEGDRHEGRLRLVPAGEHDGRAKEAYLGDDLGHVRAGFGHAHALLGGLTHALRVQRRSTSKCVALYNSEVREMRKPP